MVIPSQLDTSKINGAPDNINNIESPKYSSRAHQYGQVDPEQQLSNRAKNGSTVQRQQQEPAQAFKFSGEARVSQSDSTSNENPNKIPNNTTRSVKYQYHGGVVASDTNLEFTSKSLMTVLNGYEAMFHDKIVNDDFYFEMNEQQLLKYDKFTGNSKAAPENTDNMGGKAATSMTEWSRTLQKWLSNQEKSGINLNDNKNKLDRVYKAVIGLKERNWYEELVGLYKVAPQSLLQQFLHVYNRKSTRVTKQLGI